MEVIGCPQRVCQLNISMVSRTAELRLKRDHFAGEIPPHTSVTYLERTVVKAHIYNICKDFFVPIFAKIWIARYRFPGL